MRGRRRPRSKPPSKGARGGGGAGQGGASRPAGRGLGHGRAPPRPEADPAPGLGARGQRPVALGHHRYEWLQVVAFVQPTSGETVWYLATASRSPLRGAARRFARQTGAGRSATSSSCSTTPAGTGRRAWPSPRGSAWCSCRPTARSCSRPSASGRWSTRRSPTGTSPRWMRSTPPSPALPSSGCRYHQAAHRFPLVAQASHAALISRIPYHIAVTGNGVPVACAATAANTQRHARLRAAVPGRLRGHGAHSHRVRGQRIRRRASPCALPSARRRALHPPARPVAGVGIGAAALASRTHPRVGAKWFIRHVTRYGGSLS
jgi:hypothetical protein